LFVYEKIVKEFEEEKKKCFSDVLVDLFDKIQLHDPDAATHMKLINTCAIGIHTDSDPQPCRKCIISN
jgi:hypothetical protein